MTTELFDEFEGEQIRKLGVRVSNLSFGAETQPTLEEWESESRDGTAGTESSDGSSRPELPLRGQTTLWDFT